MKLKALAVDDATTMRKMVSFTLRDAGFDVTEAVDGVDGLQKLATARFDLIITDLNMPRMDGIQFTRQVRAVLGVRSVPILILTTESEMSKKHQAREAGATGWIVKPFQQSQLISIVSKVVPSFAGVR